MSSWIPITERLPPDRTDVLLTGDSGMRHPQHYFVVLGRTDMSYRPPIQGRVRFLDPTNTNLADKGYEVTHWRLVGGLLDEILSEPS